MGMGLYTDAGMANLPQTIAMIGGSFVGVRILCLVPVFDCFPACFAALLLLC